ncbi:nitrous oxide reductase accessory protein NosL [Ornithinibacillus halophilus]|uniref:Copper chaperone NosL n=1 Tax=Ornithinibacillus halophilus TaxID=930117 RepID=A0A1M5FB17_9BACI|nr:nitrous oxide reductase accessory protein NosL [Ornithinibacillus halophilus]SHF88717.1 copper chaperone NosL [Ornithinibacillus halophilus]
MRKIVYLIAFMFISVGILVGCSEDVSMEPVEIDESVDSCDVCHMGIQDKGASSQIILNDGTPKKFDDIGCMLTYYVDNQEEVGKVYVHDYHSNDWIDMVDATFIQDSSISSPMSYGIIAFESQEDAEAFQQDNGGEMYVGDEITDIDVKALKAMGHGGSHE